jgi:two-component system, OmpR family, response regulator
MRVLIVEDDQRTRSFVAQGLTAAGFLMDESERGDRALALATGASYDAAIIDLMVPGLDGLSVIQEMRRRAVTTPIIVLSANRSLEDRVRCLEAGADDYVRKPFSFTELRARLQALLRRSNRMPETAPRLEAGGVVLDLLTREVRRNGRRIDLQPREFSLLEHLMRNEGHALSKAYLIEKLWGYSFAPDTNVVDVLVCRLRAKLESSDQTKLIHTLRGVGYVFREADRTVPAAG